MNQPLIQARHAQPSREKPNQGGGAAAVCICGATPAQPMHLPAHNLDLHRVPTAPPGHMMPPRRCGRLCHAALLTCLQRMPAGQRVLEGLPGAGSVWPTCAGPGVEPQAGEGMAGVPQVPQASCCPVLGYRNEQLHPAGPLILMPQLCMIQQEGCKPG